MACSKNTILFKPRASLLLMFSGEVYENIRTSINGIKIYYVDNTLPISFASHDKLMVHKTNAVILSLVIRE